MAKGKDLSVFLRLNSKAFTSALKRVETRLGRFSKSMQQMGSTLSRNVSMPLIGLGAASVKLASDFQSSMTKIQTLVGLPAEQVQILSDRVKDLSGTTATAPQELAEGLYFLTSAGLDASSAMEALESVAKGTAIGLGEQGDLAKVAAAAQNAYGSEVVSASDALDMFGTMVRTGMFESAELANVLGSQLGLAANLGIEMEELGAMISTYTRTTGSATDATTGLSGIMMSFAKVTPKAEEALKNATASFKEGGMDAKDLREMLGEKGLQGTLLFLQEQFQQSGIPLSEFFSKSQALKGVLGVLGEQTGSYTEILDQMGESQGFVNDAFETTSQTAEFKFKQSIADLKTAGIELGESLMPIATGIANAFSKMARSFSGMSEESREKLVKLGLALVALGPTLIIIGKIVKMFQFVVKVVRIARGAVIAVRTAMLAMNPVGALIAGIVGIVALMIKNFEKVKPKIVDVINLFINLYNESIAVRVIIEGIKFAFKSIFNAAKFYVGQIANIFSGLGKALVDLLNFRSPKESLKAMWNDMKATTKDFAESATNDVDQMMKNIEGKEKVKLITDKDIDNTLGNVKNKVNGFLSDMSNAIGIGDIINTDDTGEGAELDIDGTANIEDITFNPDKVEVDENGDPVVTVGVDANTDKIDEKLQNLQDQTQSAFNSMADSQKGGLQEMVSQTKSAAREIIKAEIAKGTAKWAASVLGGVPFPANAILAATAGVVVGGIFNAIIPPFAQGGLVTGPTLAMVGEGSGTSAINPEVIAPLDKLKGMIAGGSGGRLHGRISGSDILLSNDRGTMSQDRVSGSVTNF